MTLVLQDRGDGRMARGRGGRRLRRRGGRSRRRLHPFLDRRAGAGDGGQMVRRPRRSDAGRRRRRSLGDGLRWEPSRGGALFPHLYGALPMSAVVWSRPLPLGPDGRHVFGDLEPVRLAGLVEPLVKRLPPETAHRAAILGLKIAPPRPPAPCRSAARGRGPRPDVPQSARPRRRLRQERRGSGRDAEARLRLRRGRHADAAAAGRQRPPAPVPAARGRRGHQPLRLQQRGLRARRGRGSRGGRAGLVGVNVGANKDAADRIADYALGVRTFAAARRLSDDQRLLAQYAGPARPAAARGAGRADRAGRRGARRERAAPAAPASRSRPTSTPAGSTTSSRSRFRAASTA